MQQLHVDWDFIRFFFLDWIQFKAIRMIQNPPLTFNLQWPTHHREAPPTSVFVSTTFGFALWSLFRQLSYLPYLSSCLVLRFLAIFAKFLTKKVHFCFSFLFPWTGLLWNTSPLSHLRPIYSLSFTLNAESANWLLRECFPRFFFYGMSVGHGVYSLCCKSLCAIRNLGMFFYHIQCCIMPGMIVFGWPERLSFWARYSVLLKTSFEHFQAVNEVVAFVLSMQMVKYPYVNWWTLNTTELGPFIIVVLWLLRLTESAA